MGKLENKLSRYASAPSPTEMDKIQSGKDLVIAKLKAHLDIPRIKAEYNLSGFDYDVYLQGSYANSTNIRFTSDVDIVVQLNSVFGNDLSKLTDTEKLSHASIYPNSALGFKSYKAHIEQALVNGFGRDRIENSRKCIKISGLTGNLTADVVPAFQYRLYRRFNIPDSKLNYVEGMKFYNTDSNEMIVNYPKQHKANCEAKNVDSGGKYKDLVRIFKSYRDELINDGVMQADTVASYYVENLLYNCSSQCFDGSYTECMSKTLEYLFNDIESDRLKTYQCANEQYELFGEKGWELSKGILFVSAVAKRFLADAKEAAL